MNKSFNITSKQLIFVLIGSQMATGMFSLPRVVSAEAGQNAWISILIGALIPLFSIVLIERVLRLFPDSNLIDVTHKLLGKLAGSVIVIIFTLYLIFFAAVVTRIFSEMVSVYMLPQTPIKVITLLIIILGGYIINMGATVVGRANEILFYISILSLASILFSLPVGEITNLLPVGQMSAIEILKGARESAFSYAGAEVLLVYYFFATRKDEVLIAGKTAVAIVAIVYVIITITALLVFGAEHLQAFLWPVLVLFKAVGLDIFQRLEFLVLATWLGIAITPTINLVLAANVLALNFLKLDFQKFYTSSVVLISILTYLIANIPQNILQAFSFSEYIWYAALFTMLIYPILLNLAVLIRKKVYI